MHKIFICKIYLNMKKIFNNKTILFLTIISIIGFIIGIVFLLFITKIDKLEIRTTLTEYISLISSNNLDISKSILNNIFKSSIIYFIIFISSVIFILTPVILFVNFYSFFIIGVMISSFIYTFKLKGLLYLLYLCIPFKIINAILIFIFIFYSLKFSKNIYKFFCSNEEINIKQKVKKYIIITIIFIICTLLINILEVYISSLLFQYLMK